MPVLLIASAFVATACGGTSEPTTPAAMPPSAPDLSITLAQGFASVCVGPNASIPGPRAVVVDAKGKPVADVRVAFSVMAGNGSLDHNTAVTDADGVAHAGQWRLGAAAGVNAAVASLENGRNARFSVSAVPKSNVIAVFQLKAVDGLALPQTFSGGGNSWTITGGHYYLAENGTYQWGYELGPEPPPSAICSGATYRVSKDTITFALAPGAPGSGLNEPGFLSIGVLSPDHMTVNYWDVVDFRDETYTLASGSLAALAPRP